MNIKVLILFLMFFVQGCAYVVVDSSYYPKATENVLDDSKVYNPNDVSNVISFDGYDFYISTDDYETVYRGFQILGFEVQRDDDYKYKSKQLRIYLGVKSEKKVAYLSDFSIVNSQTGEVTTPSKLWKVSDGDGCYLEKDVGKHENSLHGEIKVIRKDVGFSCFNMLYDLNDYLSKYHYLILKTGEGKEFHIFFSRKNVIWKQTH